MHALQLLQQRPDLVIQLVLDGLWAGGVLAPVALGMWLVWRVLRIISLHQGEMVMLGGFIAWLGTQAGLHPVLGVLLAAMVLFFLGRGVHRLLLQRLDGADVSSVLLVSFGLSITLQQLMLVLFGAEARMVDGEMGVSLWLDGSIVVPQAQVLAFVMSLGICAGVWVLLHKSHAGRVVLVVVRKEPAGDAMPVRGQPAESPGALVHALNAALCGAAGALLVMGWFVHPYMGLVHTLQAAAVMMIAGAGGLPVLLPVALGVGIADAFAGFLPGGGWQPVLPLLLLMTALLARWGIRRRRRAGLRGRADAATWMARVQ